jgi:hypothetical protein
MLVLFEVFLAPGHGVETNPILSDEVIELTQAQVMTPEQAEAVGFSGLPEDPAGRARLFIAVAPKDSRLIHTRLEGSHIVSAFRIHEVNM